MKRVAGVPFRPGFSCIGLSCVIAALACAACGPAGAETPHELGRAIERGANASANANAPASAESAGASDTDPLASLRGELARSREEWQSSRESDAQRIRDLEAELAAAKSDRARRENEWLAYTQTVTKLGAIASSPPPFDTADPAVARAAQSSQATLDTSPDAAADLARRAAADDRASRASATSAASSAYRASDASSSSGAASSSAAILSSDAALAGSARSANGADHRTDSAAKAQKAPAFASPAEKRDHEIFVALRSLLLAEQVSGFDLLESGALRDGATGPVVMRVLDERGHPLGTLYAERMHLEGSRAARMLTLVLEDGFERRGRDKTDFAAVPIHAPRAAASSFSSSALAASSLSPTVSTSDTSSASTSPSAARGPRNARRIVLPDIDPRAWIESVPELFGAEEKTPAPDDGRWDLGAVRAALNDLLRLDASAGLYRVQALGGVEADMLRDVQLDALDRAGHLERKLFADRMRVAPGDQGVMIVLEGGAQLRGDEKTPFLDNRYRIFLPRASLDEWRKAGVPGLSPAPDAKKR